jgi:hypothetical protein
MSRKAAPSFRQIASPLDIPDSDLHSFAEKAGVPTLHKTEPAPVMEAPPTPQVRTVAKSDDAKPDKITLELPAYLALAVKRTAVDEGSTLRHIIIKGLQRLGFTVRPEDLVPDNRGIAAKMRKKP